VRSLGEVSARISAAERRAMVAERETVDRLIAHFLADRIGVVFKGRIGGVTRSGLFVKLDDTGADGFIPAATLGDEYFRYEERTHALVGDASRETYRLGDAVTVRLVRAPVAGAAIRDTVGGRRDATAHPPRKGIGPRRRTSRDARAVATRGSVGEGRRKRTHHR
jgi:ribonuclease R